MNGVDVDGDASVTVHRLADMTRGWFVGAFTPTLVDTEAMEVAVQHFAAGAVEAEHHHKVATEITVIVSGRAVMCGRELAAGDVIVLPPGVASSFVALEDTVTTVVKHPGARNDKYPGRP